MSDDLQARMRAVERTATVMLNAGVRRSPADTLRAAADAAEAYDWDVYGERGAVEGLEARVRELLGKPAAAFVPSGIMGQQAVLRAWCDDQGMRRVALPDLSHLLLHEMDGPRELHDLTWAHLTTGRETPTAASLDAITEPLGAVLAEIPLRDGGYLLPTWDELVGLSQACRDRGVPFHLDGARLWESQPWFDRPLAEIADLADSVYVSFYKGLGGLAGAVVAGPEGVVEVVRTWRKRMGGTLFTLMPYAVTALTGLDSELPRMAEYHARAVELAPRLREVGLRTFPEQPQATAFFVYAEGDPDTITTRVVEHAEQTGRVVSRSWRAADVPGWAMTELTVGAGSMVVSADEHATELAAVVRGEA